MKDAIPLHAASSDCAATDSPPIGATFRLKAADGLRGLAALYVVFFHLGQSAKPLTDQLSRPWRLLTKATDHGHLAVSLFIVLSGFVLMIPVAQSRQRDLKGGFGEYIRRRARRILPAYYAALVIFLILGTLWHVAFNGRSSAAWANPFMGPASVAGVASHFVLLHNFARSWVMTVDNPMWSVATEWQIYFFFPLVLLPIWRRTGVLPTIAVALAIGMIPVMVAQPGTDFDTFCPWFLALFAMGMAAADLACSPGRAQVLPPRSWGLVGAGLFIAVFALELCLPREWNRLAAWERDVLHGLWMAALLVYLARCRLCAAGSHAVLPKLLETGPLMGLGAFSYSLYLIHLPLLRLTDEFLSPIHSSKLHVLALLLIAPTISVAAAYLFHLAFERPRRSPRSPRRDVIVTTASPHPAAQIAGMRRLSA